MKLTIFYSSSFSRPGLPADRERGQLEAGDQDRPGDPGPRVPHQRARAGAPASRRPRRGVHQGQEEVHEERRGVHQEAQREAALGLKIRL